MNGKKKDTFDRKIMHKREKRMRYEEKVCVIKNGHNSRENISWNENKLHFIEGKWRKKCRENILFTEKKRSIH